MANKKLTEELKAEIIAEYLKQPISLHELELKFNLSHPTVTKVLKDVPKYKKAQVFSPELNEHFFSNIDSEEKAYFLGLIIADGNIFRSNNSRQDSISITLWKSDSYILEKFKSLVKCTTSLVEDDRKTPAVAIAVRSNIMSQDLAKFGVIPNKTLHTYLPKVDSKFMNALIRGILDGDGSILGKQHGTRFLHAISFCGTHQLMSDISDYIFTNLDLNQKPKVYDYKDKNLSEIKIQSKHDIIKLGDWLYKDATVYLIRKKVIYDMIKNHYTV